MPSENSIKDFVPKKKLHRLSWIFVAAQYLRQFIAPLAVALVIGARANEALFALLLIFPLIIAALWHQWIYRYDFGPRGLVIREGLFFRNVRNIDYRRIENVDTERNLLHRLLGLAEVRVETSSGGSSEAVIRVLDLASVEEMRQRIFAERDGKPQEAQSQTLPAEKTLIHLSPGELVRYGLIDNRGLIVVAAVFGLLMQIGTQEAIEAWIEPMLERLPFDNFASLGPLLQALFLFSTIAGLIAGTRILSVLLALVTLHDFRLTRKDEDLRIQYGLLTRMSLTLRRPRIQAAHQKATLLHRLFRRVSLRVDLAGGIGGGQHNRQHHHQRGHARKLWLAPVCSPEKAQELIHIALPQVTLEGLEWRQLSPRARARLFRLLSVLWIVFAGIPTGIFLHWWSAAIVFPAIPLIWLYAHMYVKYTGWALHREFFVLRRGWLTRRLSVCPRNRIQNVRLSESPFDRRYRMASFSVDTAGASAHRMHIPFLDREDAERLARALYRQETTHLHVPVI